MSRDLVQQKAWIADRRKLHEPHAAGVVVDNLRTDLQREARFANPARAGERHKAGERKHPPDLNNFSLAAHKAAEGHNERSSTRPRHRVLHPRARAVDCRQKAGFREIDNGRNYSSLRNVHGLILVSKQSWYQARSDVAVNFVRAWDAITRWLYDPANKNDVPAITR